MFVYHIVAMYMNRRRFVFSSFNQSVKFFFCIVATYFIKNLPDNTVKSIILQNSGFQLEKL